MIAELFTLFFALELGAVTENAWLMYETDPYIMSSPSYYTELEVEVEIADMLFAGGSVKTRMWDSDGSWTFYPFNDEYIFNAGLRFDPVEVGFRHLCTHPVIPYISATAPDVINYEGSYDEFYIRFEIRK